MSMEKERNDWKETIREVMHIRIRHHTENADFMRDYLPHSKDKLEWHESEIASLRNALELFEEMCERDKKKKTILTLPSIFDDKGKSIITDHPLKELKNPKNPE